MDLPSILHPQKRRNLQNFFLAVEQLGMLDQSQRLAKAAKVAEEKTLCLNRGSSNVAKA